MTAFNKELFNYHGGYLTYTGDYEGRPVYEDGPNVHPTRVGKGIDLFIARFKYNKKDKAGFLSFLIKNFTVEEYAMLSADRMASPYSILRDKGYISKTMKDACIAYGQPVTEEGWRKAISARLAA